MEVMEIDENEDVPSANKDQMWKTLISAIAPYIIKRDKENFIKLKNVLDMMQNSLTFEDPGMFLLKPLSKADQDDLEFRYLWLLNTLMLITLDDEQKM